MLFVRGNNKNEYNDAMARLLYQGHASIRLETKEGKIIYIDPYAGEGYDKSPDLVLITHEHYDHNAVHLLSLREDTIVIRAKDALIDGTYFTFDYFGVHIESVPACNKNHPINECVGYLLTLEGNTIYIAGDTSFVPFMETELAKRHIDYAFLPIDGIYNMGPEEASKVANTIKPVHLLPYHTHPGMLFDIAQAMKVHYEGGMLLQAGRSFDFGEQWPSL